MKKIYTAIIACAAAVFLSSCQRGDENSIFDLDTSVRIEEYFEASVPELANYEEFMERQSSGEAHMIVEPYLSLTQIGEKQFYPVYVGEQWDDHRVNWEWFYVSEQMDEILWYNLADDAFCSLEEWRGLQRQLRRLTAADWFVYAGEFYAKTEEDGYAKGDFPDAVQQALQEWEGADFCFKKEENRLILESETGFFIYDFDADTIERHETEQGHLGWQVYKGRIYYIAEDDDGQTRLMAYDMALGSTNEIDVGEHMPVQFHIRWDGAIGMWGENVQGDKEYCFLEEGALIYVPDADEYFGWTYLCGFTERGILLEREYPTSSRRGTQLYEVAEDGAIRILPAKQQEKLRNLAGEWELVEWSVQWRGYGYNQDWREEEDSYIGQKITIRTDGTAIYGNETYQVERDEIGGYGAEVARGNGYTVGDANRLGEQMILCFSSLETPEQKFWIHIGEDGQVYYRNSVTGGLYSVRR